MKFVQLKSASVIFGCLLISSLVTDSYSAVYSQTFTAADGTTGAGLGDSSSINGAGDGGYIPAVRGNVLELTNAANTGTTASFITPSVSNSSLGFTVTFDLFMQDTLGGNPPADGFSFNYGNSFTTAAIFGEEGPGGTNSISWVVDTWVNTPTDQGIRSKVNGADVFVQSFAPLADGASLSSAVSLTWSPVDGMSLSLNGTPIFTNQPAAGFTGGDDYLFGFGARTGGATETVTIDNLVITTVPEPTGVIFAGLGGLAVLLRRRR